MIEEKTKQPKIASSIAGDQNSADLFCDFWPSKNINQRLFSGIYSRELKDDFWTLAGGSFLKGCYQMFADFFEGLFHIKSFVELPEALKDKNAELWPILRKIASLKGKGIVENLYYGEALFNDEPKFLMFNIVPDKKFYPSFGINGVGKSLSDEKSALLSALGELVERLSLKEFYPPKTIVASFAELGEKAVNPDSFCGLSRQKRLEIQESGPFQKNHPRAKVVFDGNTKFRWVKARSFLDGRKFYVPWQLVSLNHSARDYEEPFIRFPLSTGAAAGETIDDALLAGILEVIERDAFMITWFNQLSPEIIDFNTSSETIRKIERIFKRYCLEFYVVVLPTDFEIPVFLGVVIDRTGLGPAVVVGTKAAFDFSGAIESVAEDILAMRLGMRKKMLKSGSPDLFHLTLKNRAFYWYPVKMIKEIDFLIQKKKKPLEYFEKKYLPALAAQNTPQRLKFLAEHLKTLNFDAYEIEITAKELSYLKIPAVMVLMPKAQPLYVDECFPYFSGERLRSVPEKFGFKPADQLPRHPHPFA